MSDTKATTETLDKLYLEWSQFTGAKTRREIELQAQVEALGIHRDILAEHMAHIMAITQGCKENTLEDVVAHCLEEIEAMSPNTEQESE